MQDKDETISRIGKLKEWLDRSTSLVIGAGAGLSTSSGFNYSGERFKKHFSEFEQFYGFHDMYTGGFFPYKTLGEYWAFWSKCVILNRYTTPPRPVYQNLLKLVSQKDYFVLTTNVDHQFQSAGFDEARLFYTQGDFGLL